MLRNHYFSFDEQGEVDLDKSYTQEPESGDFANVTNYNNLSEVFGFSPLHKATVVGKNGKKYIKGKDSLDCKKSITKFEILEQAEAAKNKLSFALLNINKGKKNGKTVLDEKDVEHLYPEELFAFVMKYPMYPINAKVREIYKKASEMYKVVS